MPDSPATSWPQTFSRPMPSGLTRPIPVTTTRLIGAPFWCSTGGGQSRPTSGAPGALRGKSRSAMRLDKADRILDGDDLLGRVIRDLAAELLLESHHQFDRVEAVRPQIVNKTGILGHLGLVDAEMLDDDLLDPVGEIAHSLISSSVYDKSFDSARSGRPERAGPSYVAIADPLKARLT